MPSQPTAARRLLAHNIMHADVRSQAKHHLASRNGPTQLRRTACRPLCVCVFVWVRPGNSPASMQTPGSTSSLSADAADQCAAPQSSLRQTCSCLHAGPEPLITPVSRCLLVSGVHPDVPERKLRTYLKADFSILGERHAPRQLVFHTIQWVTEPCVVSICECIAVVKESAGTRKHHASQQLGIHIICRVAEH